MNALPVSLGSLFALTARRLLVVLSVMLVTVPVGSQPLAASKDPSSNETESATSRPTETEPNQEESTTSKTADSEREATKADKRPLFSERVVVTATRVETPTDRVGSSVTVLDGEDLARKQYRLVEDALREVPGIDVRRTGGPGSNTSVFMRGADADHTLVLVDGIEVNDPSTPAGTPFLDHLTPDNVERIEVLRGPQSTLYGSDAIGGVINIITGAGGDEPTSDVWAEGGSFSTFIGGFRTAGGNDRLRYSASGSRTSSDSFSATASGTEDDPYRNTTVAGRIAAKLSEDLSFDVAVRHLDAAIDFDGFFEEESHRIDARQTLARFAPRLKLLDGRWEQRFGVRFASHERDTSGSFPSVVEGERLGLDWQNDLRWTEGQTLTVGLDTEWEDGEFPFFDDSARNVGVYAQHQIQGARWFGTVGLRLDDHSKFGSRTTYRLTGGRGFQRTDTIFRASFGTGFKAPTLSELNESAFAGNPDLNPEESWGFDVGVEQRFSRRDSVLGVTYFQNRIDELIVAVFDPATGGFRNFNVDEAETKGVETTFAFEGKDRLALRASYTYTDTEARGTSAGFGLSEGSELLRRPKHKGAVDVRYRLPKARTDLTLGVVHVGDRQDIDPVTFSVTRADEYTLVRLAASYEATRSVQIFGRIENLLDEEYEDVLGFSTADRSAYAGVKLRFRGVRGQT